MKAIVKSMWIDSATQSLETYCPEDPKCFGLWVEMRVGPDNEEGAHDYRFIVCTPDWIKQEYGWEKSVWGRHMLIVFNYDLNLIAERVRSYVESCTGKDFWEMAQKISRIALWEFEDYHQQA
jgi:hypothetical protein